MIMDVHMIKHSTQDRSENQNFLISKLEKNRFTPIIIEGVDGHIGKGRKAGFKGGDSEFVSFIDDDDDFDPVVMQSCLDLLKSRPDVDAVTSKESSSVGDGPKNVYSRMPHNAIHSVNDARYIHHLVVLRRSSIDPYLHLLDGWPNWCEFALWITMIKDGRKFLHNDVIGYHWNSDPSKGAHRRIKVTDDVKKLISEMMRSRHAN